MDSATAAALYAVTHRGTDGDLEFYQGMCEGSHRVLELGSGYGRILAALADSNRRVVGIERDPALMDLARKTMAERTASDGAPFELLRADMRDFQLRERFDRIVVPHSGMYCMLSDEDCVACLRAAHDHLEPDGLLILDAYAADAFHREAMDSHPAAPDDFEPVMEVELGDLIYDVLERNELDPERQRIDAIYRYCPREGEQGGGDAIDITIAHRYWLSAQVEPLLVRAGLKLRGLYGGFDGAPFDEEAEALVVIASPGE